VVTGIYCFGVPDYDGEVLVGVEMVEGGSFDPEALWAVQVPFYVHGPVQIGTLFDTQSVDVPEGSYNFIYPALAGTEDYSYVLRVRFSLNDTPQFRILKKGGEITTDTVLRRDADPAQ